jgi:cytochrome c biogenesis protein CcmG, thiol:disulfide interchange protein DsbE
MTDTQQAPTEPVSSAPAAKPGLGSARLISAVVGVLIAALVIVLATRKGGGDNFGASRLLGKPAPQISGVNVLSGQQVSLAQMQSIGIAGGNGEPKFAVVNFFGSWCPPCADEHPELKAFAEEHAKAGDAILFAVAYQDTPKDIKKFFKMRGGDWPVVDSNRSSVEWGVLKAPETFLVDQQGYVVWKASGGVTQKALNRVLAEAKAKAPRAA